MNNIWRLQKKAVRLICNVPFDAPTADLFKNLRFMNIFERHLYQLCISVFKILSSHNSPMSNLISLQNNFHSYNLRSNTDFVSLEVPFPHKESFKKSFYYSAPFIWNRLPRNARSAPSLAIFEKLCKSYILSMNVCNNIFKNRMYLNVLMFVSSSVSVLIAVSLIDCIIALLYCVFLFYILSFIVSVF